MRADHLEVEITMCDGDPDSQCHRGDLAIDHASHCVAAATTAPVDSGRIFRVAHGGKRLDIEPLQ